MSGRSFYPMKTSVKIALLFVLIWFTGKYSFFYFGVLQDAQGIPLLVMWNILCLLLAMAIGTYIEKRSEDRSQSTALGDVKSIMGGGLVYTVAVSVLLYVYYAKIDPDYNAHQIQVAEQAIQKSLDNPKELKEIRSVRPEYKSMSKEEIFSDMRKSPQAMYSAGSTMTLSLLGLLLLSTINALILTVIFRKLIFRN